MRAALSSGAFQAGVSSLSSLFLAWIRAPLVGTHLQEHSAAGPTRASPRTQPVRAARPNDERISLFVIAHACEDGRNGAAHVGADELDALGQ
eukprot:2006471-Rhodomonas_salina.1